MFCKTGSKLHICCSDPVMERYVMCAYAGQIDQSAMIYIVHSICPAVNGFNGLAPIGVNW